MPAILNNFDQLLLQGKYLLNSWLMQIKRKNDYRDPAQQTHRTLFPFMMRQSPSWV